MLSKTIKPRTAAWLERGCQAILNVAKERAKAGDEQIQTGTQMAIWLHGWMAGVQTASILSHDLQKTPPLLDPPNDWYDQAKIAASVVNFYDEYRADIDADIPAYALMICWYRVSHPHAPDRYKASTRESLRDMAEIATKTKR